MSSNVSVTYNQWDANIQKSCEVKGFLSSPHLFPTTGQSSFPGTMTRKFVKYSVFDYYGNTNTITYSPQNSNPTIVSNFLLFYTDDEVNGFESFYELRDSTSKVWALDTPMDTVDGLILTITARATGHFSIPVCTVSAHMRI